ncbi:MAG: LamG domain-containing protein, partial [Akkermansiaceae bacterium]|nr:LamG domain-containing protein [Akkermansiaceae bacterium]
MEIDRTQDHSLDFGGGWGHDASLGHGSFRKYHNRTIVLTITKHPGPMRPMTRFHINGEVAGNPDGEPPAGRETIPEIRHRGDVGAFLGRAPWGGCMIGDVGEILVYNRALEDDERLGVEAHLAEKFGLLLKPLHEIAPPATFSAGERGHWAYQPVQDVAPPSVSN